MLSLIRNIKDAFEILMNVVNKIAHTLSYFDLRKTSFLLLCRRFINKRLGRRTTCSYYQQFKKYVVRYIYVIRIVFRRIHTNQRYIHRLWFRK